MRTSIIALVIVMAAGAAQAQKAPGPCKGLEQGVCGSTAGCVWQAERTAGEPSKAGTPYKRTTKAHCRKVPVRGPGKAADKQDA